MKLVKSAFFCRVLACSMFLFELGAFEQLVAADLGVEDPVGLLRGDLS